MGTNYIAPIWRMPRNANKDKLSNYSIDFSAAGNEYITVASSSELDNVPLGLYSISFWLKFTSVANMVISEKRASNSFVNAQFTVHLGGTGHAGELSWYGGAGGGTPIFSSSTLNDGNWHHIALVAESTSVSKMYIDGQLDVTSSTNRISSAAVAGTFRIGSNYSGSYRFHGQLSQYCIFDYALDLNQVDYLYNLNNPMAITGAEPVAYWPLGDNSNPNANAGYPNISVGADSVFEFANDDIEIQNIGNLFSGITNFSFSGWFNLAGFSHIQMFNIVEGSNWRFSINMYANQLRFNIHPGIAWIANLQNITNTNQWFHYAGVFDGSGASDTDRLKLYINGQPQTVTYNTTTPTSFPTLLSTADISIGGALSPFQGMVGKSSNIQLWTSSLTPSEVETLYNNGQPLMTGAQPQEANLKAWYKLNQSANWEADSTGNWQIPDNRSAFPQSFNFIQANGDYINTDTIDLGTENSISLWFNDNDTGSNQYLVGGIGTNSRILFWSYNYIIINPDGGSAQFLSPYRSSISPPFNTPGVWAHYLITRNGDTIRLFINGDEKTVSGSSTGMGSTIVKNIGASGSGGAHFANGQLSNVVFWNSDQSSEKDNIYNNGIPATSYTNNPVAWYKLDDTSIWYENTGQWGIPNSASTSNQVINFSN